MNGTGSERSLTKAICDVSAPDAVTTSGVLAEVLQQLGLRDISVLTPCDAGLTGKLHDLLAELSVHTLSSDHLGLDGGLWKVDYRLIAERMLAADHGDAGVICVSCTNPPTLDRTEPLDKPAPTANQLTMWACLRRIGLPIRRRWLREVA